MILVDFAREASSNQDNSALQKEDQMEEAALTDKGVFPTESVLQSSLGKCFQLWQNLFEHIHMEYPDLSEEWRFYSDGKRWLMKVHKKTKTICWVSVWKGVFKTTCYFTDKAEEAIASSAFSDELKEQFRDGKRYGKIRGLTVTVGGKKDVIYAQQLIALKLAIK